MRFLLVMWLALGLTPGLGEIAETVVHFARSGHVAHTEADQGDLGDQGPEHGCGTTQHRCGCCASQVFDPAPLPEVAGSTSPAIVPASLPPILASLRDAALPFRPPIAS
jgi:hypothetical protein